MRTCAHCQSSNDLTRVFCAECGTRLAVQEPASRQQAAATKAVGSAAPPLPAPPTRRISPTVPLKQAQPRFLAPLIKQAILLTIFAAALAALVQILREPDGVPPVAAAGPAAAQQTLDALKKMENINGLISSTVHQNSLNGLLASTIRMAPANISTYGLGAEFQRAFVRLTPGRACLGIEQKFFTRSVYFLLDVEPQKSPAGLEAKVVGGAIGRLPMPAAILPTFQRLFQPTISALSQPLDAIRQADAVTIQAGDVKLQWDSTGSSKR